MATIRQLTSEKLQLFEDFMECCRASSKMDTMTDVQFAAVLRQYQVDLDLTSLAYEVVDQAIDRLARSDGGAIQRDDDGQVKP